MLQIYIYVSTAISTTSVIIIELWHAVDESCQQWSTFGACGDSYCSKVIVISLPCFKVTYFYMFTFICKIYQRDAFMLIDINIKSVYWETNFCFGSSPYSSVSIQ